MSKEGVSYQSVLFLGHVFDSWLTPWYEISRWPHLMELEHLEFINKTLFLNEDFINSVKE